MVGLTTASPCPSDFSCRSSTRCFHALPWRGTETGILHLDANIDRGDCGRLLRSLSSYVFGGLRASTTA
ncbi:hypothetical protein B0T14DRAFT_506308 [Immersiella caudata]|uniref:Uncharacterized protein n=1 Tax=Immersiella caudata TaxID=314043 RepID=A0AA40CDD2_9PEZI|nr:hypothetical protein B0T14DRAFT_506308 [Immersiella caudata]